ncbi:MULTISPECIES: ABC transporter ATP-binding protein [unclassified Fusibacter]|uniref:ABC transporter ATP-binding protein n=1 Tax=unclassified Fusibacter TaxID=2624464 RepID=UPI001011E1DD|nr:MULTISPECIES: ABC transporter ATP-binding protein [unclassified Fusibacter]MCK8061106.1 ABC transporter ATP-binding protein [Fusibacter sp. A2]NPE23358.1 ABC transporter ATP-binding protein [Fusibacter sp. A1]RXV59403.1 ABC transporter ATP-binding protein [Fusibacter sp. A1]
MNVIEINNLVKTFPEFSLNQVSLTLPEGYIMGLIGSNGAGKTTLIKIMMGLYHYDDGDISILGLHPIKDGKALREHIGFVFDEPKYYDFSLKKIKKIISPFYKEWNDALFYEYLKKFRLKDSYRFKKLSRGMKLKFSLAIALSHNAKLLILDEPTSGLDPVFRTEFLEILQSVIENGKTSVLFSTHITTDAEKIADYITYIRNGSIEFSNTLDQVMSSYLLVKGQGNQIPKDVQEIMLGSKVTPYNYEALVKSDQITHKVWDIEEVPTLEQVMYFYERSSDYND